MVVFFFNNFHSRILVWLWICTYFVQKVKGRVDVSKEKDLSKFSRSFPAQQDLAHHLQWVLDCGSKGVWKDNIQFKLKKKTTKHTLNLGSGGRSLACCLMKFLVGIPATGWSLSLSRAAGRLPTWQAAEEEVAAARGAWSGRSTERLRRGPFRALAKAAKGGSVNHPFLTKRLWPKSTPRPTTHLNGLGDACSQTLAIK